jgi:hypothetical protein
VLAFADFRRSDVFSGLGRAYTDDGSVDGCLMSEQHRLHFCSVPPTVPAAALSALCAGICFVAISGCQRQLGEGRALQESREALIALNRGDFSQIGVLEGHIKSNFGVCSSLIKSGMTGVGAYCVIPHVSARPAEVAMLAGDFVEFSNVPGNLTTARVALTLSKNQMSEDQWSDVKTSLRVRLDPLLERQVWGLEAPEDGLALVSLAAEFGSENTWEKNSKLWFSSSSQRLEGTIMMLENVVKRVKERDPIAATYFRKAASSRSRLSRVKLDP